VSGAEVQSSSTMEDITKPECGGIVDGHRSLESADVERKKRRVWKNVIVISVAFLFNFNAFQGLSRLQSTLNQVTHASLLLGVL